MESEQQALSRSVGEEEGQEGAIIAVAPMLDVTNTHFRMFCRIISRRTELWTEMVVDDTVIHCYDDEARRMSLEQVHLKRNPAESPLVLQFGGNTPEKLEKALEIALKYGFSSFNLNVGCPSCKVATKGSFGAALFKSPLRVARIVNACNRKLRDLGLSDTRISVKTRIGVDEFDTYQHLYNFVSLVSGVHVNNQNIKDFASIFQDTDDINLLDYSQGNFIGADTFIIHARKAWLKGINPSKNRSVPKLKYQWAYLLTQDFPSLRFILNGGVTTIEDSVSILNGEWFMSWYSRHKEGLTDSNTGSQIEKKIRLDTQDSEDALASSPEGGKSTRDGVPPESELMQAYERLYRAISAGTWENKIKGVMIGREVMNNPFILAKVDRMIYGEDASSASHPTNGLLLTRRDVLERYSEYLSTIQPRNIQNDGQFTTGELHMYLKPAFGILHGLPGTKHWRRILSDLIFKHKQDLACSGGSNPRDILLYSISLFEKDYPEILDST